MRALRPSGRGFRQSEHQQQQETIMFQVLDHADVVYTGELSQTTQYVIEHYGNKLDDAIRSGNGWQTRVDGALKDWLKTHTPA
jgi:uncharacterized protein (DUF4415 family)